MRRNGDARRPANGTPALDEPLGVKGPCRMLDVRPRLRLDALGNTTSRRIRPRKITGPSSRARRRSASDHSRVSSSSIKCSIANPPEVVAKQTHTEPNPTSAVRVSG
eukprot:2346180-Rhodomonas_salina.7